MIRPLSTIPGADEMAAPDAQAGGGRNLPVEYKTLFVAVDKQRRVRLTVDGIVARCGRVTYDELRAMHERWMQADRTPWLDDRTFFGPIGSRPLDGVRLDLRPTWVEAVKLARAAIPSDVRPHYKSPDQKVVGKRLLSAEERAVSYGHAAVSDAIFAVVMADTLTDEQWDCLTLPWLAVIGDAAETLNVKARKPVHRRSGSRITITQRTPEAAKLGVGGTLPGFRAARSRDVLDTLAAVLGTVDVSGIPDAVFERAQRLLATIGVEVRR